MNTSPESMRPASAPLVLLGHSGHELRIYGWMKLHRPEVWVITDGSGATATSRIGLTRDVLRSANARPGSLLGAHSDREVYAAEGYNPARDLCQLVAAAAAGIASRETGATLPHFSFPLTGHPDAEPSQRRPEDITLDLDQAADDEKIRVALDYARAADGTLLKEVEETLARFGSEIFQRERLFAHPGADYETRFADASPFYERHGEKQARGGHYQEVIRHGAHMVPPARVIRVQARSDD